MCNAALTVGTIIQLRLFGGVIGVVICRVAQSAYLGGHLSQLLGSVEVETLEASIGSISQLRPEETVTVRRVYGGSFNLQFRILTCVAAANFLAALLTLRRYPKSIEAAEDQRTGVGAEGSTTASHNNGLQTIFELEERRNKIDCKAKDQPPAACDSTTDYVSPIHIRFSYAVGVVGRGRPGALQARFLGPSCQSGSCETTENQHNYDNLPRQDAVRPEGPAVCLALNLERNGRSRSEHHWLIPRRPKRVQWLRR